MEVWTPTPKAVLHRFLDLARLGPEGRALDIGCGRGEAMAYVAETHGAEVLGVDHNERAVGLARSVLENRGVADRATVLLGEFKDQEIEPAAWDLVLCVGSSHAVGEGAAFLDAAANLRRPGGWVLVGELYWRRSPAPEYRDFLVEREDEIAERHELIRMAEERGLEVVESYECSIEDWEAYEGRYADNVERWVAAHPEDPDATEMLEKIRPWREQFLKHGHDTLGFNVGLFR